MLAQTNEQVTILKKGGSETETARNGSQTTANFQRFARSDFFVFIFAKGKKIGHHFTVMSQHPSLKGKSTITAKRSVLKRFERVELMQKRGEWSDGRRVIGLPKTKPEE